MCGLDQYWAGGHQPSIEGGGLAVPMQIDREILEREYGRIWLFNKSIRRDLIFKMSDHSVIEYHFWLFFAIFSRVIHQNGKVTCHLGAH